MGVSDEIFYIIIGSVSAVVFAAIIASIVIIRKRIKKRKLLAQQSARTSITGTTMQRQQQQQGGVYSTYAPVAGNMNGNGNTVIMPYGTGVRVNPLMSMSRTASVHPATMQQMAGSYGAANGTTSHSYGEATIATTGPSWRQYES